MSSNPSKSVVALVKQRDNETCIGCGREGGNIHHRRMRSQSPKWSVHNVENLVILCGSGTTGCHGWAHANPEESYLLGLLVHSWDDPLDVPLIDHNSVTWFLTDRGTKIRATELSAS